MAKELEKLARDEEGNVIVDEVIKDMVSYIKDKKPKVHKLVVEVEEGLFKEFEKARGHLEWTKAEAIRYGMKLFSIINELVNEEGCKSTIYMEDYEGKQLEIPLGIESYQNSKHQ